MSRQPAGSRTGGIEPKQPRQIDLAVGAGLREHGAYLAAYGADLHVVVERVLLRRHPRGDRAGQPGLGG